MTDTDMPETDLALPFQLDSSQLRGRLVRLGPALNAILTRHDYPQAVAHLLAETVTLAAALAATLKFDGVFTLQAKGDGPVRMLVADATSDGHLRGYAQYDADRLPDWQAGRPAVGRLLGQGHMAFTVDQGENTERYQGIVDLSGDYLDDCVRHYFRQSEQIATGIVVGAARDAQGAWRGGAILLQSLPDEDAGSAGHVRSSDSEDDWRRSMLLLGTCTDAELLDTDLPVHDLLFRLFHEEQVRVYAPHPLMDQCRCSQGRVEATLQAIPRREFDDLKIDGKVAVTCEFCATLYEFDDAQLDALHGM